LYKNISDRFVLRFILFKNTEICWTIQTQFNDTISPNLIFLIIFSQCNK